MVQHQAERLPVEVAAWEHLIPIREDDRVVGDAVHLDAQRGPDVIQRVADRPVHLRHAPQAVSVLHARTVHVRGPNLAAREQGAQISRHCHLAQIGAKTVNPGVEGDRGTLERFQRQRPGDIGRVHQQPASAERQQPQREHGLGPVDQRQPLFGFQV